MTIFGGLMARSVENPTVPLSSSNLLEWLTGAKAGSGVAVTEKRVMGLPAYYRALAITAGTIAALPLHTYRAGTRSPWSARTVLDKPNPRQTSLEWRISTLLHGLAWGNSFNRKIRDGSDTVREVWPIHPSRARAVEVAPTGTNPAGKLILVRNPNGTEERLTPWDVMHIPYMSIDGVEGVRPLEVFRQSLGIGIAGDDSTAKFLANGSRVSGILTTDKELAPGVAEKLKARWKALTAGVDNAGEIGVLDNGAKFLPVSIPPADAQLLQGRQWTVSEIARMVGTPPHLVGDITNSTSWGTGIEQQVLGWVKFTLGTWITGHEQRFDAELLPDAAYSKHSLEGLLRGDSAARAAFYHSGIVDGWLSRNEVRDLEDREPVDGLDEFIVPSNMTLISVDGEIVPLSAAGSTGTT